MRRAAIVALMLVAACSSGGGKTQPTTTTTSTSTNPGPSVSIVENNGLAEDVVERIKTSTSCSDLQHEFDTAFANRERYPSGSVQAQRGTKYMELADARMQEIGCY